MKAAAQASAAPRPPRAVVGSQISFEEEMFGAAFDGRVIRRFWSFVVPHRRRLGIGVIAVLAFTPHPDRDPARAAIRNRRRDRGGSGRARRAALHRHRLLRGGGAQLRVQLHPGVHRRADLREPALRSPPGDVPAFAARLSLLHGQDRGGAAHVPAPGRRQRAAGVPRDLHLRDRRPRPPHRHRHRAVVPRPAPRSAHPLGGAGAARSAHRLAATRQAGIHAGAGDELGRQRSARGERARHSHHPGDGPRGRQLRALRRQGEGQPVRAPACVEVLQRDDSRSSTRSPVSRWRS